MWQVGPVLELAAVLLQHRAAQAQANAHALGLGGEEGREQLFGHLGRNARPSSATLNSTQPRPAAGPMLSRSAPPPAGGR